MAVGIAVITDLAKDPAALVSLINLRNGVVAEFLDRSQVSQLLTDFAARTSPGMTPGQLADEYFTVLLGYEAILTSAAPPTSAPHKVSSVLGAVSLLANYLCDDVKNDLAFFLTHPGTPFRAEEYFGPEQKRVNKLTDKELSDAIMLLKQGLDDIIVRGLPRMKVGAALRSGRRFFWAVDDRDHDVARKSHGHDLATRARNLLGLMGKDQGVVLVAAVFDNSVKKLPAPYRPLVTHAERHLRHRSTWPDEIDRASLKSTGFTVDLEALEQGNSDIRGAEEFLVNEHPIAQAVTGLTPVKGVMIEKGVSFTVLGRVGTTHDVTHTATFLNHLCGVQPSLPYTQACTQVLQELSAL